VGEFALSYFVPSRRRFLRVSGFHARARASVAIRRRGLLRGMALVSRGMALVSIVSISLIAGLTVNSVPAAAGGGQGGESSASACSGAGVVTAKRGELAATAMSPRIRLSPAAGGGGGGLV
jgi:hypothetical protein